MYLVVRKVDARSPTLSPTTINTVSYIASRIDRRTYTFHSCMLERNRYVCTQSVELLLHLFRTLVLELGKLRILIEVCSLPTSAVLSSRG